MTFLNYLSYTKEYVNGLCTDLCDVITSNNIVSKFYRPESTTEIREVPSSSEITFVPIKSKRLSGTDKPKDDIRRAHEILCIECGLVQEEYKRLRAIVEQLSREYEDSKEVDYFRRYGMLKGMIKRSILHFKLRTNEDHNQVQATCGKQKEEQRKREEQLTGLTTDEISEANEKVTEQIKEYKRKISMTKDLIETMERSYENAKRYIVVQRYRLMKNMIKTVIHNRWI